jgi:hypothetical protein
MFNDVLLTIRSPLSVCGPGQHGKRRLNAVLPGAFGFQPDNLDVGFSELLS